MRLRDDAAVEASQGTENRLGHISRITLRVRNLEASIAFYRKVLGFRPIERYESPDGSFRLLCLAHRSWGTILQLYQDLRSEDAVTQGTGFLYLVILVPDLRTVCALAAAQGGAIISGPESTSCRTDAWHEFGGRVVAAHRARGVQLAIIADPDGHPIELIADRWLRVRLLLRDLLPLPLVHLLLKLYGPLRDRRRRAVTGTGGPSLVPYPSRSGDTTGSS